MRPRFRLGLRTVKTALAVMLALYFASLFGELSIFPALAAVAVMVRSFDEGLRECRNQAVGIFIGGLFGCGIAYAIPYPPIWIMGLGVMVIIFLCSSFHVDFSCSLSCAIFIVACMSEPDQVTHSVLLRLFHTAIGLSTGLAINYLVIPYNNAKKIYSLMQELIDLLPDCLDLCVFHGLYPDLSPIDRLVERLQYEVSLYHHQRFLRKRIHRDEYIFLCGCLQLSERIQQELKAICAMDCIGQPDADNLLYLRFLGLQAPEDGPPSRHSTAQDDTVTNYHLQKLLEARTYLLRLLKER